jgi:hypothetical protein
MPWAERSGHASRPQPGLEVHESIWMITVPSGRIGGEVLPSSSSTTLAIGVLKLAQANKVGR